MARWSAGRRPRRAEAYGHSIVRYSALWSSMRPASSMSTLIPAVASWKAAMPPEAPLPTTMTSHGPEVGWLAAFLGLRLLPAVRAILAVHGQAAHELEQYLVALVAELLVDADLGRVVAVDGRLLR